MSKRKYKQGLSTSKRGFTIIEIMIVLAIAGIIMLVVFLAVPALQRSSRNTQRKSDVAHLTGLISEWQSNHGGIALAKLNDSTSVAGPNLANENFSIFNKPTDGTAIAAYSTSPAATNANLDTFFVYTNATCSGSTGVNGGGGPRSFVVLYLVEPGPTLQCSD